MKRDTNFPQGKKGREEWCWTGVRGIGVNSLLNTEKLISHNHISELFPKKKKKKSTNQQANSQVLLVEITGFRSGTGGFESKLDYLIIQESHKMLLD